MTQSVLLYDYLLGAMFILLQRKSKLLKAASAADGKSTEQRVLESDEDTGRKRKHTGHREKHSDHKKLKSDKHKAKEEQV